MIFPWTDFQDLTYSIHSYPRSLSRSAVKTTLNNSFQKWQKVSKLTFKQLPDNDRTADIIINAFTGFHGDQEAFDGRGSTLAHAFYPDDNKGKCVRMNAT